MSDFPTTPSPAPSAFPPLGAYRYFRASVDRYFPAKVIQLRPPENKSGVRVKCFTMQGWEERVVHPVRLHMACEVPPAYLKLLLMVEVLVSYDIPSEHCGAKRIEISPDAAEKILSILGQEGTSRDG